MTKPDSKREADFRDVLESNPWTPTAANTGSLKNTAGADHVKPSEVDLDTIRKIKDGDFLPSAEYAHARRIALGLAGKKALELPDISGDELADLKAIGDYILNRIVQDLDIDPAANIGSTILAIDAASLQALEMLVQRKFWSKPEPIIEETTVRGAGDAREETTKQVINPILDVWTRINKSKVDKLKELNATPQSAAKAKTENARARSEEVNAAAKLQKMFKMANVREEEPSDDVVDSLVEDITDAEIEEAKENEREKERRKNKGMDMM